MKNTKRILIVAATQLEIAPLIDYLNANWDVENEVYFKKSTVEIELLISGVGILATTFRLAQQFAKKQYDYALQAGIGGVYPCSQIGLGEVVRVSEDRLADLGVKQADNSFSTLEQIGIDEPSSFPIIAPPLPGIFAPLSTLALAQGLTVQCPLGDAGWRNNFEIDSNAIVVESMEGSAFHYVCSTQKIPFVQLRSLSNWIEPRDKSRWQLKAAVSNLNDILIDLSNTWIKIP